MLLMGKFPVLLTYIVPSFLSTAAMYVQIWFCFSLSTGSVISHLVPITFNVLFSLSCAVLIPFRCRFIWPLFVDGELSGRYFSSAVAIRPVHVANWLFRMALMSVCLVDQKRHWRSYWMRFPLEIIFKELLEYYLLAVIVWTWRLSGGVPGRSGRIHNIVDGLRVPCNTSYCYIRLSIFLCRMTLCSRRHITHWRNIKRYGLGQVQRVPAWMPWGATGDPSWQCV